MGNQNSIMEGASMQGYEPPLSDFKLKHTTKSFNLWQHHYTSQSMIQYQHYLTTKNDLEDHIHNFKFRNTHPLLVSSLYWLYSHSSSSIATKISIFYERIYTNLSKIKDIPFHDSLHFYYVALRGFQLLFNKFDYFDVSQGMFHLSDAHKLKVWCHEDFSRLKPETARQLGSQTQMVKKIIRIINQNTDHPSESFPLGNVLYHQGSKSFEIALQKLKKLCTKFKWVIPEKLSCLEQFSPGEIENILDQYSKKAQRKNKIIGKNMGKKPKGLNLSKSYGKQNKLQASPPPKKTPNKKNLVPLVRPQSISISGNQSVQRVPSSSGYYQPTYGYMTPKNQVNNSFVEACSREKIKSVGRPTSVQFSRLIQNFHGSNDLNRSLSRTTIHSTAHERNQLYIPLCVNQQSRNIVKKMASPPPPRKIQKQQRIPLYNKTEITENIPIKKIQEKPKQIEKQIQRPIEPKIKENDKIFTNSSLLAQIQAIRRKYTKQYTFEPTYQQVEKTTNKNNLDQHQEFEKENNFYPQNKENEDHSFIPSRTEISNNLSNFLQKEKQLDEYFKFNPDLAQISENAQQCSIQPTNQFEQQCTQNQSAFQEQHAVIRPENSLIS